MDLDLRPLARGHDDLDPENAPPAEIDGEDHAGNEVARGLNSVIRDQVEDYTHYTIFLPGIGRPWIGELRMTRPVLGCPLYEPEYGGVSRQAPVSSL